MFLNIFNIELLEKTCVINKIQLTVYKYSISRYHLPLNREMVYRLYFFRFIFKG